MIKALGTTPNGPIIVFGLSAGNIKRLQDGQPIKVNMREMGIDSDLIIFAGDTEATMAAEMVDLIGPDTKVTGMKQ